MGKFAHAVGTKSQLGKASPRCGDGIPALGKLAHAVGKELQAYFFRFLSMSRFSVSTEAVVVKPSWGVFMQ